MSKTDLFGMPIFEEFDEDDGVNVGEDVGEDVGEETEPQEIETQEEEFEEHEEESQDSNPEVDKQVAFIEQLKGIGIDITAEDVEEFGGDINEIVEVKKIKIAETKLQEHLTTLHPENADAIRHLLAGGSLEELTDLGLSGGYTEEQIISDPDIQRKIIAEREKGLGRTPKQIETYLRGLGDDLSDEALEAEKELKTKRDNVIAEKQTKASTQRDAQKAEVLRIKKVANTEIDGVTEFIPGVKLTPIVREAAKKRALDVFNKIYTNPDKYVAKLALLEQYGILDGDFKIFEKVKSSDATKRLKEAMKSTTNTRSNNPSNTKDVDYIKLLTKHFNK